MKRTNQSSDGSKISKNRWRKIKKISQKKQQASSYNSINRHNNYKAISIRQTLVKAHVFARLKAFVTDMFMIYTPILYITTYLILGGAQNFRHNQLGIFICVMLYGIISALFISISTQTPGLRYARLTLVCADGKKVGFIRALIRFLIWIFGSAILLGLFTPFFRRDNQFFHDLICKTILKPMPTIDAKT